MTMRRQIIGIYIQLIAITFILLGIFLKLQALTNVINRIGR